MIDLEDASNQCSNVEFPQGVFWMHGALLSGNVPFICGGKEWTGSWEIRQECYALLNKEFVQVPM